MCPRFSGRRSGGQSSTSLSLPAHEHVHFSTPSRIFAFRRLRRLAVLAFYTPLLRSQVTVVEPVAPDELSRVVIQQADRRITVIEVAADDRPKPVRAAPAPAPEPSAAESVEALRQAAKDFHTLSLQATIYPVGAASCSLLRGQTADGREWEAVSSADFRLLTQLGQFETATTVYAWFPFVDVGDENDPKRPTHESAAAADGAGYRVTRGAPDSTTIEALDHLHAYHAAHRAELLSEYTQRIADNERRERELREHPPKKPDIIIRYANPSFGSSAPQPSSR